MRTRFVVGAVFALVIPCACSKKTDPNDEATAARRVAMRSQLTTLAKDLEARRYPRPLRRGQTPLTGVNVTTFGDAFTAHVTERDVIVASAESTSQCALLFMRNAVDDAAKKCTTETLVPSRSALVTLLDQGRAAEAGVPREAHPLEPMIALPTVHRAMSALCSRAGAEIYSDVRAMKIDEAALTCTQMLEVSRDYMMGANLVGAMISAACVEKINTPCEKALDALSAEKRQPVSADIQAVADSLPPFAEYAEAELVGIHLPLCGSYLDAGERSTLGPLGKRAAAESDTTYATLPLPERPMRLVMCLDGFEAMSAQVKAYRAPKGSPERTQSMAESRAKKPAGAISVPALDKYEEKLDAMRAQVTALAKR